MTTTLLDTDMLSKYFRGHPKVVGKVEKYLAVHGRLNISIITYYEVLNGLLYKDARKQLQGFEAFIQQNNVLPLTMDVVRSAATIYARLRKEGQPIGHTDTLIAATALGNQHVLVTNNTAHFTRIDNLLVENWKE